MRSRPWLPVAVAGVILVTSLVPGGGPGGAVGPVGIDKLLHVCGYAILAATSLAAIRARTASAILGIVLLVTVFGGVVELLQGPVPGRAVSLLDLVADAVGASLAAVGWWVFGPSASPADSTGE